MLQIVPVTDRAIRGSRKNSNDLNVSGTIVHRMESSSHKKMSSAGPTIVVLGAGINGAALARQFVLNNKECYHCRYA